MALTIKTNLPALQTLNILDYNSGAVTKENEKLSSGLKINGAGDDASGYAISEKMDVQVRGLDQDRQNTQNGQNMLRVAEGAIQQSIEILTSMKEKAISAANDDKTEEDRQAIQAEFNQYIDQLDYQSISTYNGKCLVDGSCTRASDGVSTHLTNTSFDTSTISTTKLTDLKGRSGQSLGLLLSDRLTVSWTINGQTKMMSIKPLEHYYATGVSLGSFTLAGLFSTTLGSNNYMKVETWPGTDVLGHDMALYLADSSNPNDPNTYALIGHDGQGCEVVTNDGGPCITIQAKHTAGKSYIEEQIAGITFNFYDANGNALTAANAVFDAFFESIRAEDPSEDNSLQFQIGTKSGQAISVSLADSGAVALGLVSATGEEKFLSVGTQFEANAAINVLESALQKLTNEQTDIGSALSRLDHTDANLTVASENTTASMSTIRDADMAREMMNYARFNVLQQASQSMLAQANQNSSTVMSLLQG